MTPLETALVVTAGVALPILPIISHHVTFTVFDNNYVLPIDCRRD
jgi:hypothetical protein